MAAAGGICQDSALSVLLGFWKQGWMVYGEAMHILIAATVLFEVVADNELSWLDRGHP